MSVREMYIYSSRLTILFIFAFSECCVVVEDIMNTNEVFKGKEVSILEFSPFQGEMGNGVHSKICNILTTPLSHRDCSNVCTHVDTNYPTKRMHMNFYTLWPFCTRSHFFGSRRRLDERRRLPLHEDESDDPRTYLI